MQFSDLTPSGLRYKPARVGASLWQSLEAFELLSGSMELPGCAFEALCRDDCSDCLAFGHPIPGQPPKSCIPGEVWADAAEVDPWPPAHCWDCVRLFFRDAPLSPAVRHSRSWPCQDASAESRNVAQARPAQPRTVFKKGLKLSTC